MNLSCRNLLFVLMMLTVLAGCSLYRIDSEDTTLDFYPPKKSLQEVVYMEKIDKPYEVVGMVTVSVENARPFEEVLARMRNEAAILGGDAITGVRSGPEGLIRK